MSGINPSSGVGPQQTQNALANPNLAAGCENLWYAPRCNPRLDPFAMNAMIAEMINLSNCAGLPYDCNRLDNMCLAVNKIASDSLYECLPYEFPTGDGACNIRYMTLITDQSGCRKFGVYDPGSLTVGSFGNDSVFGTGVYDIVLPNDALDNYTIGDLQSDFIAGTIDRPKLNQMFVVQGDFTVNCDGFYDFKTILGPIEFDPNRNGGNGAVSNFVIELDGELIHLDFPTKPLRGFGEFGNFVTANEYTLPIPLTAGSHNVKMYAVITSGGGAQFHVTRTAFGGVSIRLIISKTVG